MPSPTSWYEVVQEDTLEQGDILLNVPLVTLPDDLDTKQIIASGTDRPEVDYNLDFGDVIVISQSCDLEQNRLKQVLVCTFVELSKHPSFKKQDLSKLNQLRDGKIVLFHLLNRCEITGHETDFLMVEFANIYSLPINFAKQHALKQGERLRLLSPYKEHLSQAFARVFMRVGLPSKGGIPVFQKDKE